MHSQILPGIINQASHAHNNPSRHIGMSIEVLGRAMHHQVIAEFEGPLVIGGSKCVVGNSQSPCRVRDLSSSPQICQVHRWVRR